MQSQVNILHMKFITIYPHKTSELDIFSLSLLLLVHTHIHVSVDELLCVCVHLEEKFFSRTESKRSIHNKPNDLFYIQNDLA